MHIKPVEVTSNDRNRNGKRQNAAYSARCAHQSTDRSERHLVSVADSCHGDDSPPERIRDAVYLRSRLIKFGVVESTGEDQNAHHQRYQEQAKTFQTGSSSSSLVRTLVAAFWPMAVNEDGHRRQRRHPQYCPKTFQTGSKCQHQNLQQQQSRRVFIVHRVVALCMMRWIQLRFNFNSTAVRLPIKGH